MATPVTSRSSSNPTLLTTPVEPPPQEAVAVSISEPPSLEKSPTINATTPQTAAPANADGPVDSPTIVPVNPECVSLQESPSKSTDVPKGISDAQTTMESLAPEPEQVAEPAKKKHWYDRFICGSRSNKT